MNSFTHVIHKTLVRVKHGINITPVDKYRYAISFINNNYCEDEDRSVVGDINIKIGNSKISMDDHHPRKAFIRLGPSTEQNRLSSEVESVMPDKCISDGIARSIIFDSPTKESLNKYCQTRIDKEACSPTKKSNGGVPLPLCSPTKKCDFNVPLPLSSLSGKCNGNVSDPLCSPTAKCSTNVPITSCSPRKKRCANENIFDTDIIWLQNLNKTKKALFSDEKSADIEFRFKKMNTDDIMECEENQNNMNRLQCNEITQEPSKLLCTNSDNKLSRSSPKCCQITFPNIESIGIKSVKRGDYEQLSPTTSKKLCFISNPQSNDIDCNLKLLLFNDNVDNAKTLDETNKMNTATCNLMSGANQDTSRDSVNRFRDDSILCNKTAALTKSKISNTNNSRYTASVTCIPRARFGKQKRKRKWPLDIKAGSNILKQETIISRTNKKSKKISPPFSLNKKARPSIFVPSMGCSSGSNLLNISLENLTLHTKIEFEDWQDIFKNYELVNDDLFLCMLPTIFHATFLFLFQEAMEAQSHESNYGIRQLLQFSGPFGDHLTNFENTKNPTRFHAKRTNKADFSKEEATTIIGEKNSQEIKHELRTALLVSKFENLDSNEYFQNLIAYWNIVTSKSIHS